MHRPSELIDSLPTRTLRRPVSSIMASSRQTDRDLSEALVDIAHGDQKTDWTHDEVLELIEELQGVSLTVERFLYRVLPGAAS